MSIAPLKLGLKSALTVALAAIMLSTARVQAQLWYGKEKAVCVGAFDYKTVRVAAQKLGDRKLWCAIDQSSGRAGCT